MSLGQAGETRDASGPPVGGDPDERPSARTGQGWQALAEESVPLRDDLERELRRDHEERVQAILAGPRRSFGVPGPRMLALGALTLAALLLLTSLTVLKDGEGESPSTVRVSVKPAGASQTRAASPRAAQAAERRRRAAIRAKRAARRRARQEGARRKAAQRNRAGDRATAQVEPDVSEVTSVEASPPPPPSTPAPAPQESSSATSTKPSQVQSEFGFER